MNLKIKISIKIICFILVFQSCAKEKFTPSFINNQCDSTYFSKVIKPIFITNCTLSGCHNGEQSIPNYNSYLEIKMGIEQKEDGVPEILYRIRLPLTDPEHMPIDRALPTEDIEKIENWINSGYTGC